MSEISEPPQLSLMRATDESLRAGVGSVKPLRAPTQRTAPKPPHQTKRNLTALPVPDRTPIADARQIARAGTGARAHWRLSLCPSARPHCQATVGRTRLGQIAMRRAVQMARCRIFPIMTARGQDVIAGADCACAGRRYVLRCDSSLPFGFWEAAVYMKVEGGVCSNPLSTTGETCMNAPSQLR